MGQIGRPYPFGVDRDYLHDGDFRYPPGREYFAYNLVYGGLWPPPATFPEPIKLFYRGRQADGRLRYESVLLVPVIVPAFFLTLDFIFEPRGTWPNQGDDSLNVQPSTRSPSTYFTVWNKQNATAGQAGGNVSDFEIIKHSPTAPTELLGFSWQPRGY